MKCSFLIERRRLLGKLYRNVCTRPAVWVVKVWAKPPVFGRGPDWEAPRCELHRKLDMERLLADRVEDIPLGESEGALW
jgi:hypothetical protein